MPKSLLPTWDDKYRIGNDMIDAQHKKLFEIALRIEKATNENVYQDEIKEMLTELFNYMKEHFAYEEKYMQEISYPNLDKHKVSHRRITEDMVKIVTTIKTTNDLKEKLYVVMQKWLLEHILMEDMVIGDWHKEQLVNNMPD
ncbi:MAG TPA: hemerythrin family protein [Campylobacter avium]|uniref:bacteriohemerythrin n=1 Tax=Campylobacter avium TaxID=522485 RepID=UPI001D8E1CA4|nr:hemerythrin family protein [Campylobacter avium]HJE66384.1 hemerythrin family protein [Campylobacter avium]